MKTELTKKSIDKIVEALFRNEEKYQKKMCRMLSSVGRGREIAFNTEGLPINQYIYIDKNVKINLVSNSLRANCLVVGENKILLLEDGLI